MVNPKIILVNAMALGLILFLSMQTTCAACNPSMAIQQKKVATVGKKRVSISKKRVDRKSVV